MGKLNARTGAGSVVPISIADRQVFLVFRLIHRIGISNVFRRVEPKGGEMPKKER